MFSLHVKYRKHLQTETGSVSGPVLFTSCKMVYKKQRCPFKALPQ